MRRIARGASLTMEHVAAIVGLTSLRVRSVVLLSLIIGWAVILTSGVPAEPLPRSAIAAYQQGLHLWFPAALHYLAVFTVAMELVGLSQGPGGRLMPHRREVVLSLLLRCAGLLWLVDAGLLWWMGDLGWWWAQMWGFFIVPLWISSLNQRKEALFLAPSLGFFVPRAQASSSDLFLSGIPHWHDLVLVLGLFATIHLLVLINRPHQQLTLRSRQWLPALPPSATWQMPNWTSRSIKRVRGAVSLAMEWVLLNCGQAGCGVILGVVVGALGLTSVLSVSGMLSGLLIGSWVLLQGEWGMAHLRLRPLAWSAAVAGLHLARCAIALSPVVGLLMGGVILDGLQGESAAQPFDVWFGMRPAWSIAPVAPLVAEGWFCLIGMVAVAVRSLLGRIGWIPWLGEMRMLTGVLVAVIVLGLGQVPVPIAVLFTGTLLALAWWSWRDSEPATQAHGRIPE